MRSVRNLCRTKERTDWSGIMTSLYAKAWWQLIRFDIILWTQTFGTLYQKVRSYPLQHYVQHQAPTHDDIERVVRAFELACIWYPKHARCLHRSAALTCLLRNHGIPSFM